MEIRIRRADLADLDRLVQWRMEVLEEVFPRSLCYFRDDLEEQQRSYYQEALPAGRHIACFAYAGEEIVGCGGLCLYREMPSPDNPDGQCAYIMNIYCVPSCRKQGVGEAIVRWLADLAKERGIYKIYLETSDYARPLYERIGFVEMPDMMMLPLRPRK